MGNIWQSLSKNLVDTHCHLLDYPNSAEVCEQIVKLGMKVHCVTVRPSEFLLSREKFQEHQNILPSLGLFPLNVFEENILEKFFNLFQESRLIGEIGLDYAVEDLFHQQKQREVFHEIISACHSAGDKVLSIHSRRSAEDIFKIIGKNFSGRVIMHWYSGNTEVLKDLPENFFFSINTASLKSRQGKVLLEKLNPQQVLTETDGPYVKINEVSAMPWDTRNVVNALSKKWNISLEEVVEILRKNYERAMGN